MDFKYDFNFLGHEMTWESASRFLSWHWTVGPLVISSYSAKIEHPVLNLFHQQLARVFAMRMWEVAMAQAKSKRQKSIGKLGWYRLPFDSLIYIHL
jgi:hypothetical protein